MNPMNIYCILSKSKCKEDVICSEEDFCFPHLQWLQETVLLSLLPDLDKSGVTNKSDTSTNKSSRMIDFWWESIFLSVQVFVFDRTIQFFLYQSAKFIQFFHNIKLGTISLTALFPFFCVKCIYELKKLSFYPIYRSCCSVTVL